MRFRHHCAVLLFFAVFAVVFTYPLITAPSRLLEDLNADPLLIAWELSHNAQAIPTHMQEIFSSPIFYPNARTFLYTEHLLGFTPIAWPIIRMSGNPILALNIIALLSLVLTGWGMTLLLKLWVRSLRLSALGAFLFTFTPFFFFQFARLHIFTFAFFPFLFLSLFQWFRHGHALYLASAIFAAVWMVAASGNYAFMVLPMLCVLALVWVLLDPTHRTRKRLTSLGLFFTVLLLSIGLFYGPYVNMSMHRSFGEVYYYSMTLRDYLLLLPHFYRPGLITPPQTFEKFFFVGVVFTSVLVAGIIMLVRRFSTFSKTVQNEMACILALAMTAFILSLGPQMRWYRGIGLMGPYALLYMFVPGYNGLRAIGRMSIFFLFGLTILAFQGLSARKPTLSRCWAWGGMLVVIGLSSLELFFGPSVPIRFRVIPRLDELPPVYTWIRDNVRDDALIELPIGASTFQEAQYTYASAFHGKKIVNGYSGYFPETFNRASELMNGFPGEESLAYLQTLQVRYVVLHQKDYPAEMFQRIRESLARDDEFREVFRDESDFVYEFQPRP